MAGRIIRFVVVDCIYAYGALVDTCFADVDLCLLMLACIQYYLSH